MKPQKADTLKERLFGAGKFHSVAEHAVVACPGFDSVKFLSFTLPRLESLELLGRVNLMAEALRESLPGDYAVALAALRALALRIGPDFVSLALCRFVELYGTRDFDLSMEALKFFTPFSSSEFAVRTFWKLDSARALRFFTAWSLDADPHVRRLSSEGCRPRLPWSFRLGDLVRDPSPVLPILRNLSRDDSAYVRSSVGNHLNDITKDHPGLVLDLLREWPAGDPRSDWIRRRALRTLVKQGHPEALQLVGAEGFGGDFVSVSAFVAEPGSVRIGEDVLLKLSLVSSAAERRRIVADFVVHYVKKSGAASEKVFKWFERDLHPGERFHAEKKLRIRDFSTRKHYPGLHRVEVAVNGARLAEAHFLLGP